MLLDGELFWRTRDGFDVTLYMFSSASSFLSNAFDLLYLLTLVTKAPATQLSVWADNVASLFRLPFLFAKCTNVKKGSILLISLLSRQQR